MLGDEIWVCDSGCKVFEAPDPLDKVSSLAKNGDFILSPMPGLVSNVIVAVGERVKNGSALMVLEAMKMEHVVYAPRDCVIKNIFVNLGEQVNSDASLILFKD